MPESPAVPTTTDKAGSSVSAGAIVRVCEIDRLSLIDLPDAEKQLVLSMVGEALEVYEVDAWGRAWVEKVWQHPGDTFESHSIALDPAQMLRIQENVA